VIKRRERGPVICTRKKGQVKGLQTPREKEFTVEKRDALQRGEDSTLKRKGTLTEHERERPRKRENTLGRGEKWKCPQVGKAPVNSPLTKIFHVKSLGSRKTPNTHTKKNSGMG